MKPLRILLALLLLTGGLVRATSRADGARAAWRSDDLSATARAQLDVLTADSAGGFRLVEADGVVTVEAGDGSALPGALADWARRHGLAFPPAGREDRPRLLAAEVVLSAAGDRDVLPDAATAVLAAIATADGTARWPARLDDRPARPSEPMVDASVAPRAPPAA
ncbi:MAG: hypothetical protein GX591_01015 [Planctomycetes bacterium]|nr:hypothetical protein [Planctomycetota bacterium]